MKVKRKLIRNLEFYVLIGMLAFCFLLYWQIQKITIDESKILPIFILLIAMMSALVQGYGIWKGKTLRDVKEGTIKDKEWMALFVLFTASGIYNFLGFYTTIAFVLIAISIIVQDKFDARTIGKVLIYDAILMMVTYFCFAVLLGMVTPAGLLI